MTPCPPQPHPFCQPWGQPRAWVAQEARVAVGYRLRHTPILGGIARDLRNFPCLSILDRSLTIRGSRMSRDRISTLSNERAWASC